MIYSNTEPISGDSDNVLLAKILQETNGGGGGGGGGVGPQGPPGPQGPAGSPASQTPWAQDIDGNGFSLTNVENLDVNSALSALSITLNDTPPNQVLVTDGSSVMQASGVTITELSYLSGVTSAIQTQINTLTTAGGNYVLKAGSTMTGPLLFTNNAVAIGSSTFKASNIHLGTALTIWNGTSTSAAATLASPNDGILILANYTRSTFSRLCLGDDTATFPSLKRNATGVDFRLGDDSDYAPVTSASLSLGGDVVLERDAANTLAQRNGTNAQTFNLYNTFTNASNYERFGVSWSSNSLRLFTSGAGSGLARNLGIYAGGVLFLGADGVNNFWQINTSGHFLAVTDNTYDIGASNATRPRSGYFGTNLTVENDLINRGGTGFFRGSGGIALGSSDFVSLKSTVLGVLVLRDGVGTNFNRLQFGGTTSSFPSLKRSTTFLQARLADDSAFANIQGKLTTDANAVTGLVAGAAAALTNATITITDASGQVYRVPVII